MIETVSFSANAALLQDGAMQMVRILDDNEALSFGAALALLHESPAFREFFIETLRASPFRSFRWETPALTFATAAQPFEFVLVRDNSLQRKANSADFKERLDNAGDALVAGFANLGKDAFMIVPTPHGHNNAYAHFGAFVRDAPLAQIHALLARVGEATTMRLNDRPIWLNTAGGGVPWLHVRLDTRPKYYVFKPYARPTNI